MKNFEEKMFVVDEFELTVQQAYEIYTQMRDHLLGEKIADVLDDLGVYSTPGFINRLVNIFNIVNKTEEKEFEDEEGFESVVLNLINLHNLHIQHGSNHSLSDFLNFYLS